MDRAYVINNNINCVIIKAINTWIRILLIKVTITCVETISFPSDT